MKELFSALAKARASITGVGRDGHNKSQNYNYASAEAMMSVAGPALADNGLSVFPSKYTPDFDALLLHVEYVLAHSSGESMIISSSTPMVVTKFKSGGETPPDKALGAAKTYDLRYMLRGLLCIPQVEEDADVDQRPDGMHHPQPKRWGAQPVEERLVEQPTYDVEEQKRALVGELSTFQTLWGADQYRAVLGGKRPENTVESLQEALAKCHAAQANAVDRQIYNRNGSEAPGLESPPTSPAPPLRMVDPPAGEKPAEMPRGCTLSEFRRRLKPTGYSEKAAEREAISEYGRAVGKLTNTEREEMIGRYEREPLRLNGDSL